MEERTPCLACGHDNPLENHFCGLCGAPLAIDGQLVPRQEDGPAMRRPALPASFGPVGKALAVGLAVLATEAGLAWLRRRVEYDDRPSPLATRTTKSADSEHITGQSLEEVFVWLQEEGNLQGRGFARRVVWTSDIAKRE